MLAKITPIFTPMLKFWVFLDAFVGLWNPRKLTWLKMPESHEVLESQRLESHYWHGKARFFKRFQPLPSALSQHLSCWGEKNIYASSIQSVNFWRRLILE